MAALNEVSRIAAANIQLPTLPQTITDILAKRFGWEFVALVRIDAESGRFICEAVSTELPTQVFVGYSRAIGSGIVGQVALTGRPVLIDDSDRHPEFVDTLLGARAEICVPIKHHGEVVAILNLESREPFAFHGELPLLETIADHVAGAIAGARLIEETRRRAMDLETLSEVARIAFSADDLDEVLDAIVAYVRDRFSLSIAAVLLTDRDGSTFEFQSVAALAGAYVQVDSTWPVDLGVVGRTIRSGEPQLVLDVRSDPDYFAVADDVVAEFAVPIRFRGRIMGAFDFESRDASTFSADNRRILSMLADQAAGVINLATVNRRLATTRDQLQRSNRRLREANRVLDRLTAVDPLTHIANRRAFDQVLDAEWRRAVRTRSPLSLLVIDIDCFKQLNDSQGHQRGDECLRRVAQALEDGVRRAGDLVARYGGEEFAVVLPDTDPPAADRVAETLRQGIEALQIPHPESPVNPSLTVSVGVASAVPEIGVPTRTLVAAADAALYRAKHDGRNRVVSAGMIPPTPPAPSR